MQHSRRFAAAITLAVLFGGPAIHDQARAQAVIVSPSDPDFDPDDEIVAREYFVRRPPVIVGPSVIVGSIPLRPGSIVPEDVALAPFTDAPTPGLRRYSYFVAPGDKIVVVNPATRTVVRILDR